MNCVALCILGLMHAQFCMLSHASLTLPIFHVMCHAVAAQGVSKRADAIGSSRGALGVTIQRPGKNGSCIVTRFLFGFLHELNSAQVPLENLLST